MKKLIVLFGIIFMLACNSENESKCKPHTITFDSERNKRIICIKATEEDAICIAESLYNKDFPEQSFMFYHGFEQEKEGTWKFMVSYNKEFTGKEDGIKHDSHGILISVVDQDNL